MTDRREREIVKLAEAEGWTKVRIEGGNPHHRLVGLVDGEIVEIVVSVTKALVNRHNMRCVRKNMRRAAEAARKQRGKR